MEASPWVLFLPQGEEGTSLGLVRRTPAAGNSFLRRKQPEISGFCEANKKFTKLFAVAPGGSKKTQGLNFPRQGLDVFLKIEQNFHTGHLWWKKILWEDGTRYTSLKLYIDIRTSLVQVHLRVLQVHGQCLGNTDLEKNLRFPADAYIDINR